ncbi:MAG: hypothetical protein K2H71_06805 [Muribaculaceae bacterium]|nr:hypothetical protein [Muribaculaceae bacterium]
MHLQSASIIPAIILALLISCSDDTYIPTPTESNRIGFEAGREWHNAETTASRSEDTSRRRMIGAVQMGGQLPNDRDSLFLQIIEDEMTLHVTDTTEPMQTRSVLRSGYYYTKVSLSAYRYPEGTWDETQTPDYFNNVEIDMSGQAGYTDYSWPGAKYSLRFFGTAPSGHGILSAATKPGYPTLDYTIPSEVSRQVSLLTVFSDEYRGDFRQYVPLNFRHATASVYFKEADGLVPGSIRSISLRNLYGTGTYDFKTDSWSNLRNPASYTSELYKRVTGMDGQEITDYLTAFTVLPQQTPDGTVVEVVYTDDYTKEERTMTGVLSCRFEAGKRYDIYISPQSIRCEYSLGINGPDVFPPVFEEVPVEGSGQKAFYLDMDIPKDDPIQRDVKSIRLTRTIFQTDQDDAVEHLDLTKDCDLEFYKYNNVSNKYDIPVKLSETMLSSINYNGFNSYYQNSYYDFYVKKPSSADGAIDRALKEMPEKGTDLRPYNLSNATGDTLVQNTANCYIVNAPGTYSIPIVYGNAIKDGRLNEKSLKSDWFTTNTEMIKTPSAGRLTKRTNTAASYVSLEVTKPYIVDYKAETTAASNYIKSVKVQWQSPMEDGQEDIISDVKLSDDRRTITFKVNRSNIRQGNALISIFDSSYEMWSWHIWVTDYVPGQNDKTLVNREGKRYTVMPCYLGWVDHREGVDNQIFRMTVGIKGTTKRFELYLRIKGTLLINGETPLYQWGRPIPFMNPLTSPISYSTYKATLNKPLIFSVCSPMIVFTEVQSRNFNNTINIWNWTNSTIINSSNYSIDIRNAGSWTTGATVKTIYDPCPAGYCIPNGDVFSGITSSDGNFSKNTYQVEDSKYSNADEVYCNPFDPDPEDTYIFPHMASLRASSSSFQQNSYWALWTCSMERQSGTNGSASGHAYFRDNGYNPKAASTSFLNQVIPMREQ